VIFPLQKREEKNKKKLIEIKCVCKNIKHQIIEMIERYIAAKGKKKKILSSGDCM